MVKLTQSLQHWLWENHRDIIHLIMFGHVELFTEEMKKEYLAWCQTEDGKQYLKGGSKYKEDEDVYPVRPIICRLFGVADPGKLEGCPNGNSACIDGKKFLGDVRKNTQILNFVDWEDEPLRCVQFDCFCNDDGICASSSDYRAPELGAECPEYGED